MADRVAKHWTGSEEPIEDVSKIEITKDNLYQVLLSIKDKDITYSFIMNTFGEFDGKQLCAPYDTMDIPAGRYTYIDKSGKQHTNKNKFTTTVGLWVFNIYFFRDDNLAFLFGYYNTSVNKKAFGSINEKLSYALIEDKITILQLKRFLDKSQWMMPFETVLAPNHSEKMLTCSKAIEKEKMRIYKENKEKIDAGDVVAAEKMEKELLKFAADYMGDDAGMDIFNSGGGGSFGNNFKNIYIMKGPIKDPDPNAKQQYNVALSNFSDGISRDEYKLLANSLAAGPYSRGKKTETGGYWEKLFVSALQHIVMDEPGSDCGTKHYITPTLTKQNINKYMYSYVIEGNKLVEITSDNMDKYIGKTVKMRFSSMCSRPNGKICNICGGNLFNRIGVKNVGVGCSTMMSKLKNICMKAFHDGTVSTTEIDPMKAFSIK